MKKKKETFYIIECFQKGKKKKEGKYMSEIYSVFKNILFVVKLS